MATVSGAPASALTYAEAQQRSRLIDVRGYHVDLDLSDGEDVFGSVTAVRFGCREPGASSFTELMPARLRRVTLNGQDLDPAVLRGNRLPLTGLRADNELRVEADMPYSRSGAGMHRFTDPADGQTYLAVHAGLDSAQRVFAAFDQPDMKAPIAVTVTAPGSWTVLGNGVAGRPAPPHGTGPSGPSDRSCWELAATPPISSYLFTVLAGPYYGIRGEHRGLGFGLYSRRSLAGRLDREAPEILSVSRACFDRYLEIFDEPYPFEAYDQAFVPELEAGAVENPGCVTFRDDFLFPSAVTREERQMRAMVIAHEMAHMWFGDLVTMRWWNDVWLSESFAEYMGYRVPAEATEFTGTWVHAALSRKPGGYDADQRASTHPVAPGPADVPDTDAAHSSYDLISYAKGASALRQVVAWIGWPAFAAGLNDYITRHRFGSATLADLLDCLGRASGADVGGWAARWLRTAGVDTLAVGARSLSHRGSRPHRIWMGVYDRSPGDAGALVLRGRYPMTVGEDEAEVPLPRDAVDPPPALVLPNDGDFSYAKVRLGPRSWHALTSGLSDLADPLSRAVAWNTLRDMVRDAELAPRRYLELAARHLPAETDTTIAAHALDYARWTVADRYLPPSQRGDALSQIARLCQVMLDRAAGDDPGGMRLAAGRGLIDSASSPDGATALRSWLDIGRWPGGPDLDADLRWRIMARLAVLGAIGPPEIERQAARDTTAAALYGAARCRAAVPDPGAKQAAWTAMFDPGRADGQSSYQLAATAQGFWQADQADLLAGYVPGYFPALAGLAAHGGPAPARVVARHGFPHHAVADATLRAGQDALVGAGLTASLRRLLADQLEDLRRSLKVRSAA
jgi:aminopeptidase N